MTVALGSMTCISSSFDKKNTNGPELKLKVQFHLIGSDIQHVFAAIQCSLSEVGTVTIQWTMFTNLVSCQIYGSKSVVLKAFGLTLATDTQLLHIKKTSLSLEESTQTRNDSTISTRST